MSIPVGLEAVLSTNPDVMHGKLCFAGTRVPLTVWIANAGAGMGPEEFVSEYPTVTLDQVRAVVRWQLDALQKAIGS